MKLTVGTSPVELDTSDVPDTKASGLTLIVQNLGPGSVYFDFANTVTDDSGIQIAAGGAYEFPRMAARSVWLVSDQAGTDVRWVGVD